MENERELMDKLKILRSVEDFNFNAVDMIVEGYALKFENPTKIFEKSPFEYTEIIAKGALNNTDFSKTVLNKNHDNSLIFARTENKSLELTVDEIGLKIRANVLDTQSGIDLFKEVKSGLINKMSFAFPTFESDIEEKNGVVTIKSIDKLIDVSAVTFPAYEDTSIEARAKEYIKCVRKDNKITADKVVEVKKTEKKKGNIMKDLIKLENIQTGAQCGRALETIEETMIDLTMQRQAITDEIKSDEITTDEIEVKRNELNQITIDEKSIKEMRAQIEHRLTDINEKRSEILVSNTANDYLKSERAVEDFGNILIRSTPANFKNEWKSHLAKRSITGTDFTAPKLVLDAISDTFEQNGDIMSLCQSSIGTSWLEDIEVGEEIGLGYQSGKKTEQNLEFIEILMDTKFVYKFQRISREQELKGGAILINYILKELPQRLAEAVEKQVVVGGDAVLDNVLKPIVLSDAELGTSGYSLATGVTVTKIDENTLDLLDSEITYTGAGTTALIMNKKDFMAFKQVRGTQDKKRVYEFGKMLLNGRTYDTIDGIPVIKRAWVTDVATLEAGTGGTGMVLCNFGAYKLLKGSPTPEFNKQFDSEYNMNKYLIEMLIGGQLNKVGSAAFVKK